MSRHHNSDAPPHRICWPVDRAQAFARFIFVWVSGLAHVHATSAFQYQSDGKRPRARHACRGHQNGRIDTRKVKLPLALSTTNAILRVATDVLVARGATHITSNSAVAGMLAGMLGRPSCLATGYASRIQLATHVMRCNVRLALHRKMIANLRIV